MLDIYSHYLINSVAQWFRAPAYIVGGCWFNSSPLSLVLGSPVLGLQKNWDWTRPRPVKTGNFEDQWRLQLWSGLWSLPILEMSRLRKDQLGQSQLVFVPPKASVDKVRISVNFHQFQLVIIVLKQHICVQKFIVCKIRTSTTNNIVDHCLPPLQPPSPPLPFWTAKLLKQSCKLFLFVDIL